MHYVWPLVVALLALSVAGILVAEGVRGGRPLAAVAAAGVVAAQHGLLDHWAHWVWGAELIE